jgi:Fuc2NAc and GlcNAc transferase
MDAAGIRCGGNRQDGKSVLYGDSVIATGAAALTVVVGFGAWCGVALVRRYALRRLLDVPNDRSSHSQPTPRGGGLAVTVAHLCGLLLASSLGLVDLSLTIALGVGGIAVAVIGFLDDHGHVSASLRLALHMLALVWAILWLGMLPPVDFGWGAVNLGWVGTALLVLYLAWFLNLFNFMDGIDGIAGAQALCMSLTGAALAYQTAGGEHAALPMVLLAAATAGFLIWNWPPARIFMGDVGSGYLGFALGVLALWTVAEGWLTPWVWLILGGAFLADATVTLFVRAKARVPLVDAHRSHAYQRLSRHWGAHRRVTLAYIAVNLLWLAPWAFVATRWPDSGAACAVAALVPLFWAAMRLGAGRPGEIGAGA